MKKRHPIKYTLLLIALSFLFEGQAQKYVVTNYTTKDGLPSNLVYVSYKDSVGFLWIGTNNGLSRFNGQKFETYGPREGVLGNEVINLKSLNNGILGFYINGCFTNDGNKFKDITKYLIKNLDVGAITFVEDQDSNLIISSLDLSYYFNKKRYP